MAHSFRAHYFHLVWSTKNRIPWVTPEVQQELYAYIAGIAKNKTVRLMEINGMQEHVHLLLELSLPDNFTSIVRDIKANSCAFVKRKFNLQKQFSWQEGYGSFSVSRSSVDKVRMYIRNQPEHHAALSFDDEFKIILKRHRIDYDERFVLG